MRGPSENLQCKNPHFLLVMVGGPAIGKAGDDLDWIAGGLEKKEPEDFW